MENNKNVYIVYNTNGPTLDVDSKSRADYEDALNDEDVRIRVIGERRNVSDFFIESIKPHNQTYIPLVGKFFNEFDRDLIPVDQMQRRLDELVDFIDEYSPSFVG